MINLNKNITLTVCDVVIDVLNSYNVDSEKLYSIYKKTKKKLLENSAGYRRRRRISCYEKKKKLEN